MNEVTERPRGLGSVSRRSRKHFRPEKLFIKPQPARSRYKDNYVARNAPEKFRGFRETGLWCEKPKKIIRKFSWPMTKTFRARKAIPKTPIRLLCKAGLLIWCEGNNKITVKLRTSRRLCFEDTKRITSIKMHSKCPRKVSGLSRNGPMVQLP